MSEPTQPGAWGLTWRNRRTGAVGSSDRGWEATREAVEETCGLLNARHPGVEFGAVWIGGEEEVGHG